MFPPPPTMVATLCLTRCVRVLPHKQNTGGFFVTLLQKTGACPWQEEGRKIFNTGVKAFTRCENKGAGCDYRIAQEGSLSTIPFISARTLHPTREDMEKMLMLLLRLLR